MLCVIQVLYDSFGPQLFALLLSTAQAGSLWFNREYLYEVCGRGLLYLALKSVIFFCSKF